MAPRGIASALGMVVVANLITKMDARNFLAVGLLIAAATCLSMSGFNLQTSFSWMAKVTFLQGLGIGLFFLCLYRPLLLIR